MTLATTLPLSIAVALSDSSLRSIPASSLHRIVTTRTKRLTAQEPPNSHAAPAQRAMALNCFTRIVRTSRNKATRRRQPWRDYCLVELQERNKNDAHRLTSGTDFSL